MGKMLQALNYFNSTLCVSASLRDELFRLKLHFVLLSILAIADCGLPTADCGLWTVDCRLPTVD